MQRTLLSAQIRKQVICVYFDREQPTLFSVGYVVDISDSCIIMAEIGKYGFYSGYSLIQLNQIFRIELSSEYAQRLEKLYSIRQQHHVRFNLCKNPMESLLLFAKSENKIVTIELESSGFDDVQGFVTAIENEFIIIDQMTDNGESEGESVILTNSISHISCDSDKERAIYLLSLACDREMHS